MQCDGHTQLLAAGILEWFDAEGRDWPWRRSRARWVVLVSEVCLQQTQVTRAAPYVERMLERFPTAHDMASAELAEVLSLWQGLGFPRRARNLWLASRMISSDGWPRDYRDLPGVGAYTADAIRCFADEQPVLPLDVNTRRVLSRCFPAAAPDPSRGGMLQGRAWQWGQAVMELGQRVCRARADCGACPVADACPSAGTTEVIASRRQAPYAGSMRERRGALLREITRDGRAPWHTDPQAAESLVADGLARRGGEEDELLLPP